ncbi:ribose ABC transporter [Microvirga tunisiensis]|uniref:Ribose ABC transporter n=2 Tax=Pannonibacter tanglangensis TaxID=2750084 RepID=A0ABW9ZGP3_9HYPH|nr:MULTISPECIES: RbsD/FucU domain-containing protein [unclassified Pannonibacter]NBN63926.1 ribose ABC transporter [Pannonibacter sp. XCT-34]NBN77563.1 ribose ABC transporter [Pannonibacter sp. XCT-53]
MLKGIDPLISAELLMVLAAMGHGDEIVIVDANFPSDSTARHTVHGSALRMDCSAVRAVEAVLSLLPIDTFGADDPVQTMQVVGDPAAIPEVVAEARPLFAAERAAMGSLERYAFYERARDAYAILQTTELRPYGNFVIRKGVIFG